MCVAIPGKVVAVGETTAEIDFHGNVVTAVTGPMKVEIGDYVLVHAGMILQKMKEEEAVRMTELFEEAEHWAEPEY